MVKDIFFILIFLDFSKTKPPSIMLKIKKIKKICLLFSFDKVPIRLAGSLQSRIASRKNLVDVPTLPRGIIFGGRCSGSILSSLEQIIRFLFENSKTAEPIGPKFCVGPHKTPGKVYE